MCMRPGEEGGALAQIMLTLGLIVIEVELLGCWIATSTICVSDPTSALGHMYMTMTDTCAGFRCYAYKLLSFLHFASLLH